MKIPLRHLFLRVRLLPFCRVGARQTNLTPITVIGTEKIRDGFDAMCIEQALNSREAPGVTQLVLNPDAHCGYGAPIGCGAGVADAYLSGAGGGGY